MKADEVRAKTKKAQNRRAREERRAKEAEAQAEKEAIAKGRRKYKEFYNLVLESINIASDSGRGECTRSIGGGKEPVDWFAYGQIQRTMEVLEADGFYAEYYQSTGRGWNEDTTYWYGVKVKW